MKASDLFVKQLEEEGVEFIFGLPGEENLDLLESLRTSRIKFILTRHEQAAAFMAATYGRLTGKAGVCFSTLGPGATNLVTGVAHAQLIGAVSLMKPITKSAETIADPGTIPTVVRNAFKHAQAERPGAVHIELPEDVAGSDTDAQVQKSVRARRPDPDATTIEGAAELINSSRHPLLILSAGANRKLIWKELREFVERTGIHVVHT